MLTAHLAAAGLDVFVVAPNSDRSGTGAAIGLVHADQHLDAELVELPGCAGIKAYALDGPPGMCVIAGRLGAFGDPPDVVVSGINPGLNTGRAILHSGTVGAALTAQNFGGSGLAVSTERRRALLLGDGGALRGRGASPVCSKHRARTVLNLNVPALALRRGRRCAVGAARRVRRGARPRSRRRPTGGGSSNCDRRTRRRHRTPTRASSRPGFAALTTIVGIAEAWPPELHDDVDLREGVVPGRARSSPCTRSPTGRSPRWLHRPLPPDEHLV